MHLLLSNVLAFPHLIHEIIEESKTTLDILVGGMDPNMPETKYLQSILERNDVEDLVSVYLDEDYYSYFSGLLKAVL